MAGGWAQGLPQGVVDGEVARLERELVGLRRDIHRHPEGPGQERRTARVLARRLRGRIGRGAVVELRAAFPPFSGEDFALYLDRVPGTFTFLGVRAPGAPVTTCYPHYPDFAPDERAIGIGVRGMAGWITERSGSGSAVRA
ncbi:hypothetical protein [Streptomyces sp. NPDC014733]|uniref:hypothetical protein n=1 Tax=Streptomyces sp. NPDC014733 TaxID=3364885 RepID=UPI0036F8BAEA